MKMDRKLSEMHSPKSETNPGLRSVFEMDLSLEYQGPEFQSDPLPEGTATPKAGDSCPKCQSAQIDYDGMLNLRCPECGYTLAGCFT
jgi:hypothetical protein